MKLLYLISQKPLMITPLFSAILSSIIHVISGPDHLAAVSPLAISSQRKGWKIGLIWGFGHLIAMLLIGVLLFFFKDVIPVVSISNLSEKLVAIVLIIVGILTFYRIFKEKKIDTLPHTHTHSNNIGHRSDKKKIEQNMLLSFFIGFLHGLAGVTHFLLLLPVLSFETKYESIQYIIGFALGTIIAMTSYAIILGRISSYYKNENYSLIFKGIRFSGALFAIIIGLYWLFLTF